MFFGLYFHGSRYKLYGPTFWLKYNFHDQDELLDNCKVVAEVIPRLIEGVKSSMQNPDSALAQLNLITACEQFLEPSRRYTPSKSELCFYDMRLITVETFPD